MNFIKSFFNPRVENLNQIEVQSNVGLLDEVSKKVSSATEEPFEILDRLSEEEMRAECAFRVCEAINFHSQLTEIVGSYSVETLGGAITSIALSSVGKEHRLKSIQAVLGFEKQISSRDLAAAILNVVEKVSDDQECLEIILAILDSGQQIELEDFINLLCSIITSKCEVDRCLSAFKVVRNSNSSLSLTADLILTGHMMLILNDQARWTGLMLLLVQAPLYTPFSRP